MTTISLSEVLRLSCGVIANSESRGAQDDDEVLFWGVAPLNLAKKETISFLANDKYLDEAKTSQAGALLCTKANAAALSANTTSLLVVCDNPYAAFAKISQIFFKPSHSFEGISPQAFIDASAKVASSATIFPNVFIGPNASVGERSVLYPGSFVGATSTIGDDCILYPNSVVREGCSLGHRCILNPGAVIGGDGFGFAPTPDENVKIPQIGGVEIENDVEIGANAAIDRATLANTKIGQGTKIDNLVTVGHNVQIGRLCFIAGQTGVAGSTKIGNKVIAAGQVGISGHLTIGDGATLGPQAGITKDIPSKEIWIGSPAKPYKDFVKSNAILNRIVEQYKNKKG